VNAVNNAKSFTGRLELHDVELIKCQSVLVASFNPLKQSFEITAVYDTVLASHVSPRERTDAALAGNKFQLRSLRRMPHCSRHGWHSCKVFFLIPKKIISYNNLLKIQQIAAVM